MLFSKGGNSATFVSLLPGERNIGIHFEMAPARAVLGNDLCSGASTGTKTLLCRFDVKRRSPDGWLDTASHEEGCLMMRNNVSDREVAIDVSHASFNVIDTQVVVWTCHHCHYSLL